MFGNKDNITSAQLADALAPLLKRLDKLEAESKKIKADNKSLTDQLSALKEELATLKNSQQDFLTSSNIIGTNGELKHISPSPIGGGAVAAAPPRGEAAEPAILFLPSPTPSGTFTTSSQEEEIGKSIYKLVTDDGTHGTFELLQTPDAIATAMISVSQFLKPVCRITGNTHRMPEKIETIEKGEVKKEGEEWIVTKKAVVKFQ